VEDSTNQESLMMDGACRYQDDQRFAVADWTVLAEKHKIEFAIGGSFAAELCTKEFPEPSKATDLPAIEVHYNEHSLPAIKKAIEPFGNITHCVVTVGNGRGVPILFREFTDPLVGPKGSPQNPFGAEPNFFHHQLGFRPDEIIVPVLLPQVLLNLMLRRVLEDNDTNKELRHNNLLTNLPIEQGRRKWCDNILSGMMDYYQNTHFYSTRSIWLVILVYFKAD
jgi:hypothetical protein